MASVEIAVVASSSRRILIMDFSIPGIARQWMAHRLVPVANQRALLLDERIA